MSDPLKQAPEMVATTAGAKVTRKFHDDALGRLRAHVPRLRHGVPYTAEELFCPLYWGSLDSVDHWRLGCCVADWERAGLIPLRFAGCPLCKVRHYELV